MLRLTNLKCAHLLATLRETNILLVLKRTVDVLLIICELEIELRAELFLLDGEFEKK